MPDEGDEPDVWIVAHDMLFHFQKALSEPAAVIIDEAMWQKGIRGIERDEIVFRDVVQYVLRNSLLLGLLIILPFSFEQARVVALELAAEPVRETPIPRESPFHTPYKSWSLFLISNPSWVLRERNSIKALYDQFIALGGAIGPDNVAIWFWSTDGSVDVPRSSASCLILPPGRGPYIVVTTEYPGAGLLGFPDSFASDLKNFYVIELNGAGPRQRTRVMQSGEREPSRKGQADLIV